MDVVGPAVQQDDGRTVRRADLRIADVEMPGVDLPQRTEGSAWTRARTCRRGHSLRVGRVADQEFGRCDTHHRRTQEAAAMAVDDLGGPAHWEIPFRSPDCRAAMAIAARRRIAT